MGIFLELHLVMICFACFFKVVLVSYLQIVARISHLESDVA